MKNKIIMVMLLSLGLALTLTQGGYAQEDDYSVHLSKDFGYDMVSTIQGRFTISLRGVDENVEMVIFYIDNQVLGTVDNPPFKYQFQTEQHPEGIHNLYAEVSLKDGQTYTTSSAQYIFLSQKEANKQVRNVLIALGGVILGSMAVVALIQGLVIKKDNKGNCDHSSPRSYGLMGGTICRKCGRPFPRHIWGINLVVGRLDRCDNCGKWVMTTRATPQALRLAEESEKEVVETDETQIYTVESTEDKLEDTKYIDNL